MGDILRTVLPVEPFLLPEFLLLGQLLHDVAAGLGKGSLFGLTIGVAAVVEPLVQKHVHSYLFAIDFIIVQYLSICCMRGQSVMLAIMYLIFLTGFYIYP
jgi:hypothetical protein